MSDRKCYPRLHRNGAPGSHIHLRPAARQAGPRTPVLRCLTASTLIAIMLSACAALSGCQTAPQKNTDTDIRIGVSIYDQYDTFIGEMMDCFESEVASARQQDIRISIENANADRSQPAQNSQVEHMIQDGCDVICVNLVDRTDPTEIIDMARRSNIPVIFFNRELVEEDLMQWDRLYYVGADAFESGRLQGEMAAAWIADHPETDKNHDGQIQYVVLEGEAGHQDAILRSEYSVASLLSSGIPIDKLGYAIANWNRGQAHTQMLQMLERFDNPIELVLANNDDMALGAVDACKEHFSARSSWPAIFGIDGTSVGLAAIQDGTLTGTIYNDKENQASAMFRLAMALARGSSLEDMHLQEGKYIRLPYTKIDEEALREKTSQPETSSTEASKANTF